MFKLRKILAIIMLFSFLWANFTHADNCENDTVFCGNGMKNVLENNVAGNLDGVSNAQSLFILIMGWISFLLPYAGLLAFVGIIYAGFLYVTGFANEENVEKAKKILFWSILGLIVIFMSYTIVKTFINPTG